MTPWLTHMGLILPFAPLPATTPGTSTPQAPIFTLLCTSGAAAALGQGPSAPEPASGPRSKHHTSSPHQGPQYKQMACTTGSSGFLGWSSKEKEQLMETGECRVPGLQPYPPHCQKHPLSYRQMKPFHFSAGGWKGGEEEGG